MTRKTTLTVLLLLVLLLQAQAQTQTYFGKLKIVVKFPDMDAPRSVYAADLNNDGKIDVLSVSSAFEGRVRLYTNNGDGTFNTVQIANLNNHQPYSVYAADLDGDTWLDVLVACNVQGLSQKRVIWYKNNGDGTFANGIEIDATLRQARAVYAANLDGDGDNDVLAVSYRDDQVKWYENDGSANFTPHTITSSADGACSVYAADLDNDGDLDVLSANYKGHNVKLYTNNGDKTFTAGTVIASNLGNVRAVYAADIDGDNRLDVLVASNTGGKTAWYKNNVDGTFTAGTIADAFTSNSVYAADLDGDNDNDLLLGKYNSSYGLAWYENDGQGVFTKHLITDDIPYVNSVYAADIDGDGKLDALSANQGADDKVAWYKNIKITQQPQDKTFCNVGPGTTFTFAVEGYSGNIKWQVDEGGGFADLSDGGVYSGTTTETLTINSTTASMSGYKYRCQLVDEEINSEEATLTVGDHTAPVAPATLPDVTGECTATVTTAPTATDDCAGNVTGTTSDPLTYDTEGTHTITWTFDDGNGNTSTATQKVIIDDVTAPETPTLASVIAECSVTVTAPTTTDNCAGEITGTTNDPTSYNQEGGYTIHWTFDDGNGNTTTAEQIVTISDDNTAPVAPTLEDVTGECSATVTTTPTAMDYCEGNVTGETTDPLTYNTAGTHTITWSFEDSNGNTSTATQNVIVTDNTAPVTPTLADVTGECSVTVTAPTTTDNCKGTVTGTTSDPLTYNTAGTYTITWTFDDGNGNSTTATQNVIVTDNTAPVTPTLADVTGECSATVTAPTTTDNCKGTVTGTTSDPLTYNTAGTYTITWTFDDGNGNTSTATQNVIITDVTAPVTPTLADVTGECSVTATAPTTTDDCAGEITGTTSDPTEYTAQGTYIINWVFDDGNGNTATAQQTVIVDDTTAPEITCVGNQTVNADETHFYTVQGTSFDPINTSDNCEIQNIVNNFNNSETLANAKLPEGTTTVIWTITDGAGNENTCSSDIIVNAYVGIETLQQNGISVYPNPTTGMVNFEFSKNNIQKLKITDITGKQIIEKTEIQENEQIDLSGFESGVYIVHIQTADKTFTTKIIKE